MYLPLGAVAGIMAGLFGVGGGAIIVPMLLFVFAALQFAPEQVAHIAVGTSFATIVLTSLASMRAHHLLGNVRWSIWLGMAPGLVIGVIAGSWLASRMSAASLRSAIALFLLFVALQMLLRWQPPALFRGAGRVLQFSAGLCIGWVSAFFGIGGGSLSVPFLYACNQPMKAAVATSAACGLPIALFGALSFGYWGVQAGVATAWTTGYIYWPALVGIGLASVPFAKIGAQWAARLPDAILRRAFAGLLCAISFYLLVSN